MDEVQLALARLFGVGAEEEKSEEAERRRNRKGQTAQESAAIGAECLSEGDYDGAIEHFRASLDQREPADIAGRIDLGAAYEAAERSSEALRQYKTASRIQEGASEPHLGASQVYKQFGKYHDAIAELDRAIALEPRNAFYRFKLAEILRELKMFEPALAAATEAAAAAPDDAFYHFWVADLLMERSRFEEALAPLRLALELSPGDDFYYFRAAIAFWGARKRNEAIRAIRLASDLDPDKPLYHGLLAVFLRQTGLNKEAELEEASAEKMDAYDREELRRALARVGLADA